MKPRTLLQRESEQSSKRQGERWAAHDKVLPGRPGCLSLYPARSLFKLSILHLLLYFSYFYNPPCGHCGLQLVDDAGLIEQHLHALVLSDLQAGQYGAI